MFDKLAAKCSELAGHPGTFMIALLAIFGWSFGANALGYRTTWDSVDTATSLIAFLAIFLLQNSQNREGRASQMKLDELIRASQGAHNAFLALEELTNRELGKIREQYLVLAKESRDRLRAGEPEADVPDISLLETLQEGRRLPLWRLFPRMRSRR